ncbi:MAG: Hint domain-containing protein [Sulfitobacter sp.]
MPPPTEVIINGNFNGGNTGWSGTDMETSYTENAYLGNGSSNRVAEMDGFNNAVTVMEQTFTVLNTTATELTLDTALRTASNSNAGSEGFTIEILDDVGTVIASMTVLPTTNTLETITLPVTFPNAGDYTLRLTEVGPNDSLGAIIDNVSLMICFVDGTMIATPQGQQRIEDLRIGDMVNTLRGPKKLRWIGRRHVTRAEQQEDRKLRPILIGRGALGCGVPEQPLRVSRQHRMLAASVVAKRMFAAENIFVAAHVLTGLPDITVSEPVVDVTYFHLMFDEHEVIWANNAPSESLYFGAQTLKSLHADARQELHDLFPELFTSQATVPLACIVPEKKQQRKFIYRLCRNHRALLDDDAIPTRRPIEAIKPPENTADAHHRWSSAA